MRGNEFLDKMELIDTAYVEAAGAKPEKKKNPWVRWGMLAACLCLVFVGAFASLRDSQANTIQMWNHRYTAQDYFKFCDTATENGLSSEAILDIHALPYEETRYFSDMREELEANDIIPVIQSHPQFTFAVHYNDDGSLCYVELLWCRRSIGGLQDYSDLQVISGYEEISIITDCITVELDEKGNILEPTITVTERDGIQIIAQGRENTEKTLSFQNENGWYRISGSWNDDFESVVELLNWFWENPLDYHNFPMEAGDEYTNSTLAETPNAFARYLPDFSELGFIEEAASISLKNGVPVYFEGYYAAENTKIHWCIISEPDIYDLSGCLGDLSTLTQQQVMQIFENDKTIKFMQDDLLIIVYPDDVTQAWELIESLKEK